MIGLPDQHAALVVPDQAKLDWHLHVPALWYRVFQRSWWAVFYCQQAAFGQRRTGQDNVRTDRSVYSLLQCHPTARISINDAGGLVVTALEHLATDCADGCCGQTCDTASAHALMAHDAVRVEGRAPHNTVNGIQPDSRFG